MTEFDPWAMSGIVSRVSYKPGWAFLLSFMPGSPGVALMISYTAPDSREKGQTVTVAAHYIVPEWVGSAEAFWDWFRDVAIASTEQHEIDEFLRLDGRIVNDPHARSGPAVNPFAPAIPYQETGKKKQET